MGKSIRSGVLARMAKNLLLITEPFPPLNTIAAQRFPPMLPVLEDHGWRTWVITQRASGTLPVGLPEERIIRIGQHRQQGARKHTRGRVLSGRTPISRLAHGAMRKLGLNLAAAGGSVLSWYRPVLRQQDEVRGRLPRPDVIIGTFAPSAALWLARHFAALYRCPWIADFRDLGALRPYGRPSLIQALDRLIEARLLRTAAAATTPGKLWASILARQYGIEAHVIYNGWDDADLFLPRQEAAAPPHGDMPSELSHALYYAGLLRDRQLEGVFRVLRAIAGTPFQLVVRSLGPTELEQSILQFARHNGLEDRVVLLPPVPHHVVRAEARLVAANLVLEDVSADEEWAKGHLSGKFLQLLPLEPPIIFIARPGTEAADVLAETGKGEVCATVEDIRTQLRRLESGRVARVDTAAVFAFSKSRQAESLLEVIEGVQERARTQCPSGTKLFPAHS